LELILSSSLETLGNKDNGQVQNRLIWEEANPKPHPREPVENKQKQSAGITTAKAIV
jgi:hypothetical protein